MRWCLKVGNKKGQADREEYCVLFSLFSRYISWSGTHSSLGTAKSVRFEPRDEPRANGQRHHGCACGFFSRYSSHRACSGGDIARYLQYSAIKSGDFSWRHFVFVICVQPGMEQNAELIMF